MRDELTDALARAERAEADIFVNGSRADEAEAALKGVRAQLTDALAVVSRGKELRDDWTLEEAMGDAQGAGPTYSEAEQNFLESIATYEEKWGK